MTHVLLVGNPNCGKTTVFNALTGASQRVGNWPGVTVEKKTGEFKNNDCLFEITDLPGIYSLVANAEGLSLDEEIAAQSVVQLEFDCLLNVIDACHLERHLYLTTQLLELGKPIVVALNMMDLAQQQGISIDIKALERALGCRVIPIQAHKSLGIPQLIDSLAQELKPAKPLSLPLPENVQEYLIQLQQRLIEEGYSSAAAFYYSFRLAEGDSLPGYEDLNIGVQSDSALDVVLADARYQAIHEIVSFVQKKQSDASEHFTAKLDKIILNRWLSLPIFFAMMYLMFLFAINIGGAFQDFFDISTETIFVSGTAWLLQQIHAPNWLIALLANGVGKGINTTVTFIPVIASMFFFLSLLETSGYMARAAFVVDKIMRALGLPGKSFVPMIVGFGCNVPAIMAARTLDSERDRLLTVMMSPFMSCSARLAIYAVFVAAFFPTGGHNVVFSLYLIGILMAVLTGYILQRTSLKGHASPLIIELPAYHRPSFKRLVKETSMRLKFFVFRAGKLIIPICVILGGLNAITFQGGISSGEASTESLLSMFGQWITPFFAPMGIRQDNWPATVGLLTGMLAKEVVVGTLNTLYAQIGQFGDVATAHFSLWGGLQSALYSIPNNLSELGNALWNPVAASAADNEVSQSVYGVMAQRFDGAVGAYAYLLFVLLYIPCVSTMAVIRQEASKYFMWTSVIWSFVVAYAAAVLFYQMAKFFEHPQQSVLWVSLMLFSLFLVLFIFRFNTPSLERQGASANT
ncbi:Fe(2+) transporter permease subunit FeoB [Legionella waltersii]|uniref:Ferrous iron transport protein B n=1 Tax=Legionella waltersii TaxID=66969 RepID=A0A0W1AD56_9GAMM|nr:Fe(2+) transporter permease subunit FeoB [Legionella waltersii]KTD79257.1 ferrous iron transport protein B [Legionella waltersii]SNV12749.1 ferrous iron transport protein B [Legionella waltersii]